MGKEKERSEQSLLIRDYFMHPSIDRERRLLDEKRVKWIARRMETITEEMKERFQSIMRVEYRVDNLKQAALKKPATNLPDDIYMEDQLVLERGVMELMLLYEVMEWEQIFWNRLKALLDEIGNDRVEVKERLTREWRADCWRRLNPQMHAAEKRLADYKSESVAILRTVNRQWASSISQLFEGVEIPNSIPLMERIEFWIDWQERRYPQCEFRSQIENEMEDVVFRLKRGSELGRFDQFWDDDTLFRCRYSRSKWLYLDQDHLYAPLEIYLHALKGNKNIIHISLCDVTRFPICDLPWVTSISSSESISFSDSFDLPAIRYEPLFIKPNDDDSSLITFAKEIRPKLDPSSTYIFTDAHWSDIYDSGSKLGDHARVLISFVAPTSGQSLTLRLKHSGIDGSLKVTLGSTRIQLNSSSNSKSSLTIDDITLYPITGPSESDHLRLSFRPGRNDIVIQFVDPSWETFTSMRHGHLLHDVELLDEAGGCWSGPRGSEKSNYKC